MQLSIRLLELSEVRAIYRERMIRDFPADELKPFPVLENAINRGEYRCYGGFEGEALAAYAFFVTISEQGRSLWLFDYLAVEESRRGQGIGSAFLQALSREIMPEADMVLLEIDDPDLAEGEERLHRLRREAFYHRNGLTDTGVTARVFGVGFRILEIPTHGTHSADECRTCFTACYRHMLPPALFRRMISVS